MHKLNKLNQNQSGLVAIVVTMMMVLVLSIIVMAFFRVSQREQRQALDRQLGTQAFYAAETGINDAVDWLKTNTLPSDDIDCNPPSGYNNQIDGPSGVISYSCLLMDPSPRSLEYPKIINGESKVVPINGGRPSVGSLDIQWEDPDNSSAPFNPGNPRGKLFSGCTGATFPSLWMSDCDAGVLRIDIVPVPSIPFNRAYLVTNTMTFFATPQGGGGTITYSGAPTTPQGARLGVTCNATNRPYSCVIRVLGLTDSQYYMRIMPIYRTAAVSICSPACSNPSELFGAQTVIDSTGKANDVLRRIQARIQTENSKGPFPNYALESIETICKRFSVTPPSTITPDPDPACAAP